MPNGFLTIPNCFYLAVYPKDYARMTKIQKYNSTVAIEARRVLVNMLDNINASENLRTEIREGWKEELEIADEMEKKEEQIKEEKVLAAKKYKKRKRVIGTLYYLQRK